MKRRLTLAALLLFTFTISARAQSPDDATWLVGEHASITLTIGDKYGTLGEYDATFFVTDSRGKRVQKSILIQGGGGEVTFPDDFDVRGVSGSFRWFVVVRGRKVAQGRFTLSTGDLPRRKRR